MIKKMGPLASQSEYFNNPITEGKVFRKEWMQWKSMSDLKGYVALIAYLDPSFSDKKNSDHKSWLLLGLKDSQIHVIKAFCDRASIEEMVEWGYQIEKYVKEKNEVCEFFMEDVFYQSLLYKDFAAAAKSKGWPIPVQGDKRDKPDKDRRISACQGYFERGEVYFNLDEKTNHHMENLLFQFTSFESGKTTIKKDGPDAFEGGKHLLFEKVQTQGDPLYGRLSKPKNLY
jgi:phage terminase large subunit-like protein